MNIRNILATVLISGATTLGVIYGYGKYNESKNYGGQSSELPSNYKYAGFNEDGMPPNPSDFTAPAEASIPAVVHIKTVTKARQTNSLPRRSPFGDLFGDDMLDQLFGGGMREQRASGSGVIISADGYIVTNNHVVAEADDIKVSLSNKRSYTAKVVGRDPAYDLAVIKIEAAGLPFLVYGNSDEVKIGQWVLAIGYPLNLETTVTAGIVSAKGRSLGLNRAEGNVSAVESYLQTDAAVNQGNSGGALVNTDGRLIGINSAIASPTGYYSGYSYAIPVNIVKKVVDDIIKYGTVQRAFLGVSYVSASDMPAQEKAKQNIPEDAYGIYISEVADNGAAAAAGLRKGDIVTKINGINVSTGAELQEQISRYKPGDKAPITYRRNGNENTVTVSFKNMSGNFDVVKAKTAMEKLGAEFSSLDPAVAKQYGVNGGVLVKNITAGIISDQTRMRENFVILRVNETNVTTPDQLQKALGTSKSVTLSGFYPGYDGLYEFPVSIE